MKKLTRRNFFKSLAGATGAAIIGATVGPFLGKVEEPEETKRYIGKDAIIEFGDKILNDDNLRAGGVSISVSASDYYSVSLKEWQVAMARLGDVSQKTAYDFNKLGEVALEIYDKIPGRAKI